MRLIAVRLFACSLALVPLHVCDGQTAPPSSPLPATENNTQPSIGFDFAWKEALHLGYHYKDVLNLELGGQFEVDGGYIGADQTLPERLPEPLPSPPGVE